MIISKLVKLKLKLDTLEADLNENSNEFGSQILAFRWGRFTISKWIWNDLDSDSSSKQKNLQN